MLKSMVGIILILIALIFLFSSTITNIVNDAKNLWWWQSLSQQSSAYQHNASDSSNNFAASISATIGSGTAIAFLIAGTALIWLDRKKHYRNHTPLGGNNLYNY